MSHKFDRHHTRKRVIQYSRDGWPNLDTSAYWIARPSRAMTAREMMNLPRSFAHIDTWVFDLDNTLYPHHVNLWQQVDARIGEFVSSWLKISREEARLLQKDYYRRFGTTMRGMMTLHGVRADDYLAYVHKIDHSPLEPNPAMGAAIARLHGRKLILTNGSVDHVDKVLGRLGLVGHFDAVFDIIAAELEPKPAPQTYHRFLDLHRVDPTRAAMFEDLARNLEVPHSLGMTTVLVVPDGSKEVVREDWELEGRDASHIDYVTDDLTGFLQGLAKG
jgi:putative hydrolase of the HAD superfamily